MTTPSLLDRLAASAAAAPSSSLVEPGSGARPLRVLVERARRASAALVRQGMAVGDHVLFSVRPGLAAIEAILAIHDAGGAVVPVDPRMGDALFQARMARLAPRWVFAEPVIHAASSRWLAPLLRRRGVVLAPLGALAGVRHVRCGGWLPFTGGATPLEALVRDGAPLPRPAAVPDEEAPAFIVFTSGTTGAPKAVVHTRRSLGAILASVEHEAALRADDVLYTRDLHLILPALLAGARVVIPRAGADPARMLRELRDHGATRMFAVTSDCRALLDHCLAHRVRLPATLREILIGGAPAHASFLARLREVTAPATRVWCIYGMTEILPVARISLEEKVAYAGAGDVVGRLVAGVQGEITPGGELVVRGASLCRGYLGEPPVTEHATGDLARFDDGMLVLLGRTRDMIIRGDFNLYPGLYEPTVARIAGVRRCAFVGVYDERAADERVVLVVEPEAGVGPDALVRGVHGALRAGPHRIDTMALPDEIVVMPLPESGRSSKVDRRALRAMLAAAR